MSENRNLEGDKKSSNWECPQCTYQNKPRDRYCSICVYDRGFPKKQVQKKKKIEEGIASAEKETEYYFQDEPFNTFVFPQSTEKDLKKVENKNDDSLSQSANITEKTKIISEDINTEVNTINADMNTNLSSLETSENQEKIEESESTQLIEKEKLVDIPLIDPKSIPIGQPWSCPVCTFMNLYKDRFCGVCSFYYRKIVKSKRVKSTEDGDEKETNRNKQERIKEEEDKSIISSTSKETSLQDASKRKSKGGKVSGSKETPEPSSHNKSNHSKTRKSEVIPTSSSSKQPQSLLNSPNPDSTPSYQATNHHHIRYEDWLCPSCTLLNAGRNRYCSACNYYVRDRKKLDLATSPSPLSPVSQMKSKESETVHLATPASSSAKPSTTAPSSKRRSKVTKSFLMIKEEIKPDEQKEMEESDDELKSVADESREDETEVNTPQKKEAPAVPIIPLRETRSKTRNTDREERKIENTVVESKVAINMVPSVRKQRKTKTTMLIDEGEDTDRQETRIKTTVTKTSPSNLSKKKKNNSTRISQSVTSSKSELLASNLKEEIKHGRKRKVTRVGRDDPNFPFSSLHDVQNHQLPTNYSTSFNPMLGSFNTGLLRSMSSDSAAFQNYDMSSLPFGSIPDTSNSSIFTNPLMSQWSSSTTSTTNILPSFTSLPTSSDQGIYNTHDNNSNNIFQSSLLCPSPMGMPIPSFNPMFAPLLQQTLANLPPLTVAAALTNLPLLLANNQNNFQSLLNNHSLNALHQTGMPPSLTPPMFPPVGHLTDVGSNDTCPPDAAAFLHAFQMWRMSQQSIPLERQEQQQWNIIPTSNSASHILEVQTHVSPTSKDAVSIKQVRNSFHDDDYGSTIDNDSASDLTSTSTTIDPREREDDTMYLKTTSTNDPVDSTLRKDFKPKVGPNYQVDLSKLPNPELWRKSKGTNWNRDNERYDVIWIPTDTHLNELQDEIPLSVLLMEEIAPTTRRTRARHSNFPYPELPAPSKSIQKDKIETLMDYVEMFPSKPVVALNTLYENNYRYDRAAKIMTENENSTSSTKVIQPVGRKSKATHDGPLDMDLLVLNREERELFKSALLKHGEDDWNAVAVSSFPSSFLIF